MKRLPYALLSVLSFLLVTGSAFAASPQWLRYPAISPSGEQIAFSFAGDLWIVRTEGGRARQLTTHEAYDFAPVWSPDSKTLAFASDRFGNLDVYVVPVTGGEPRRLTFHSADDRPTSFTPDGKKILFTSHRQDDPKAAIGHPSMGELYEISVDGGRPAQILTTPAELAVPDPTNRRIAYHDYKGYEDTWRKHHQSAVARDVWIYDRKTRKHTKLTDFRGEDRNPLWSESGKQLLWLSERGGTFNVWTMPVGKPDKASQVTKHSVYPVRFLSVSSDGTICYGLNGEVWTKTPDGEPQRVPIKVVADRRINPTKLTTFTGDATEMAVSPNDDEIALVIRGEIFVTAVDYSTTKRVTDTPEQERSVVWGLDGRTLYYAGERDGSWNLYKTTITREEEDRFAEATILTEEIVLETDDETFQPLLSPDGKKLAFLNNRDEIRVLDLSTKKSSTMVPAKRNYSYSDGDIQFSWSPDSKWLAFTYNGYKRWLQDVGIVNLATGEITNITKSGYTAGQPEWSRDGRALLFVSDRFGRRSHGSWGSDEDIFGLYLTRESWAWINRTKEEMEREKRREESKEEKDEKKDSDDAKDDSKDDADAEKEDDAKKKPVQIDLRYLDDRVKRLTLHSAPLGGYDLSPDGETLVFFAQVEDDWDLWMTKIRERSTSKLTTKSSESPGTVRFSKDGKQVFVLQGDGKLSKVTVAEKGDATAKPIAYQAEMHVNGPAERAYMFEHAWRQVKRKFYRPDLHGVDWQALKDNYGAFLPSIYNNRDFAELMSEMLGELNASHTGARYRPRGRDGDATAGLGLLLDVHHTGAGLKVAEVLPRGPADLDTSKIKPGVLITHIDGQRIEKGANAWPLLNKKSGKLVRLGLHDPKSGDDWEEVIKAISSRDTQPLLYERWIRGRRELVDKLSDGRIGYVHIQGMNDRSFRRFYQDVLGRNSDKEALIVDTRFNGGGWLHDDLVSFLSGEDYIYFKPRGKELGDFGAEPAFRWSRPVVVLQSESNYSDAHMFPYAFKQLKLGKLVGTPVPGTGTAVWWETLIDRSIVFGIPQVGMVTPDGQFLENLELEPDVLVYNSPESIARGEDRQVAKCVEVLLEQLKKDD